MLGSAQIEFELSHSEFDSARIEFEFEFGFESIFGIGELEMDVLKLKLSWNQLKLSLLKPSLNPR